MSLIDCGGCGKTMVKNTPKCPHCKTPNAAACSGVVWTRRLIALAFGLIVGGWIIVQCSAVVVDLTGHAP